MGELLPSGVPILEGHSRTPSPPARWGQGETEVMSLPEGGGGKGSPPLGPQGSPQLQ